VNRIFSVSTTTLGSSLGTGGMETKIIAAEIATAAGVTTVILSSKNPENINNIIEYYGRSAPRSPLTSSEKSSSQPESANPSRSPSPAPPRVRPLHTVFTASSAPMRDLKSWTTHTLYPSGSVIIDAGAYHVLSRRESGGRLLAAGVVGVIGAFASGQAVRIVIRRPQQGDGTDAGTEVERAAVAYASGLEATKPVTPTSSLTPLTGSQDLASSSSALASLAQRLTPDEEARAERESTDTGVVEVGRGLANYNSEQILRVKGLNSSYLPSLLGYADSEYVVENISIRVPPS